MTADRIFVVAISLRTVLILAAIQVVFWVVNEVKASRDEKNHRAWMAKHNADFKADMEKRRAEWQAIDERERTEAENTIQQVLDVIERHQ